MSALEKPIPNSGQLLTKWHELGLSTDYSQIDGLSPNPIVAKLVEYTVCLKQCSEETESTAKVNPGKDLCIRFF